MTQATAQEVTWKNVTHGSNWKHRKTGRKCIVQSTAQSYIDDVKLLHESGRLTKKQVHYFLYDFEPITTPTP